MAFDDRKVREPFLRKVLKDIFDGVTSIAGIDVTTLKLGSASVTATATELNKNDLSAQTETLTTDGTASATLKVTKLNFSASGTVTLPAPDATMLGQIKHIEDIQTATNTVSIALTNVEGYTGTSNATFNASGEKLILQAGVSNWTVLKSSTGVIA